MRVDYFKDYDPKLFYEKNESLYLTPFGEYKLLKSGLDYFKNLLIESKDDNYTTEVTKEKIDQEATKELKGKYADQYRFFDEKWEEYKESHKEEFNEIEMIDAYTETSTKGFYVGYSFSLSQAWNLYNYCNRELKTRFAKGCDEYELLPRVITRRSKDEFKEKHAKFLQDLREKLKLPNDEEVTVKSVVTQRQMKRPKKADIENATDDSLDIYLDYFVDSLQ